jgi:hypothetical protein
MTNFSDLHKIKHLGILLKEQDHNSKGSSNLYFIDATDHMIVDDRDKNAILLFVQRNTISKESLASLINYDNQFIYALLEDETEVICYGQLSEIYNEPDFLGLNIEINTILSKNLL